MQYPTPLTDPGKPVNLRRIKKCNADIDVSGLIPGNYQ
jgi:hypothetical protein